MYLITYSAGGNERSFEAPGDVVHDMLTDLRDELEIMNDGDFFMVRKADYLETKAPPARPGLRLIKGGKS